MTIDDVGQTEDDVLAYVERVEQHLAGTVGDEPAVSAGTYARTLVRKGLPPLFDVDHLAYVLALPRGQLDVMIRRPDTEYHAFRIRKRGGGSRLIHAPSPALKHVQRWLLRNILSQLPVHDAAHGFVSGRTILSNAHMHAGQPVIVKFDISNFFGTPALSRVRALLTRLEYSEVLTRAVTRLVTLGGALPQGAPTSPYLANAAASRLDLRLYGLATALDLRYSRYADDITFSGLSAGDPSLRRMVRKIIADQGYAPNDAKTAVIPQSGQQRVTGLVVNSGRPHFPRSRRRWLRQEIYYLKRYGVDGHVARRGYTFANYRDWIFGHACALGIAHRDEARRLLDELEVVAW